MTRLTILCISFIIVILMFAGQSYAQIDPETILGIWLLDEGTGNITEDVSGNGNDGTLIGSPNWVAGKFGNALEFNGSSTYVDCGNAGALNVEVFSVSFWCNIPSTQSWNHIISRGEHHGGNPGAVNWGVMMSDGQATILYETYNDTFKPSISVDTTTGEWHHVVATHDGATMQLYHDGQLAGAEPTAGILLDENLAFIIGAQSRAGGPSDYFNGSIDEVGYFSVVLAPEDIEMIMTYGLAEIIKGPTAVNPRPAEEETEVQRDVVLSWGPGEFAAPTNGHKVYFSENFDDVSNGIGAITQSASSYTPAQHLDFGTTYYWRVDEVNNVNPDSPWIGDVWSFTTEPFAYAVENITATASSSLLSDTGPSNTVNGSGLDADDLHSTEQTAMWISGSEPNGAWIEFELDKIYKLHEMSVWNSNGMMESFIGYGCKDVTIEYSVDGNDYTTLGVTHEFSRAPGAPGYAHNTTIDFGGAAAKNVRLTANNNWGGGIVPQYSLSEVRFFYIPILAREPQPGSGATDMDVDLVLSWKAGREAAEHNVYISTDEQAVIDSNVPVSIVTEAQHGPISLDLGETYYWKVNEVNMAETPTMSEGDIWNFSTHEYFVVDDFEDYNDWPPDEIWSTWVDGYGVSANGATAGYPAPDFLAGEHYVETANVHGGAQSMPFFYDNTGTAAYSEGERTFAVPQNWTEAGIQTLSLWFHGTAGNTGQLYVEVNGSKVVYNSDAADMQRGWQPWNIELASFGTNLQNVTTLGIGIDGNGASGTLYFDDIRLYSYSRQFITPAEPNNAGLVGHYKLDQDATDSSGNNNHGTLVGNPQWAVGKIGGALSFDGITGIADRVEIPTADISVSAETVAMWAKLAPEPQGPATRYFFGHTTIPAYGNRIQLYMDDSDTTLDMGLGDDHNRHKDIIPLATEIWYHIALTWDGSNYVVYVNGAATANGSYTGLDTLNTVADIGNDGNTDGRTEAFNGLLDDVRFYNYALSLGEVAWLAGRTEPFDKPF